MRLSCQSAHQLLIVSRPRLTARCTTCRFPFGFDQHRPLLVGFQSVYLTERFKFGMSPTLQSSFSQMQRRSFVSHKTNGSVPAHNGDHHEHHGHHKEHKHNLFGAHEHEHGTDAEKVIEALKGGGELSVSVSHSSRDEILPSR
jgi:hypothetical protein